jgi:hypothetical protein
LIQSDTPADLFSLQPANRLARLPNPATAAVIARVFCPRLRRCRGVSRSPDRKAFVMLYQDRALRTYAEVGMRSTEDWQSFGRVVVEGVEPRARVAVGGKDVPLYTRDQTQRRAPSARRRAARLGGGAPAASAS